MFLNSARAEDLAPIELSCGILDLGGSPCKVLGLTMLGKMGGTLLSAGGQGL